MINWRVRDPGNRRLMFLTALLASGSALPALAATADATADSAAVGEVIVTATKRSENLQNVPVSVQALTPTVLENHQVQALDDYVKLLPSVSFQSFGPGQSQLYFRGISSGGDGLHGGSEPATGVYVDETPLTTIANGVDMHIYDIARVEALSGPQGTLFGASSLSGTLRIITNQPDPRRFSAGFDLEGNTFTDGSPGGTAEGFVNVPITQHMAIRLVGFYEHDGGYIDNVLQSRTFHLDPGSIPPDDTLTVNNAKYVKNNFNDVDTYGGRAALRIDLDEHWSITPGVIYQHQRARGNFLMNPRLGDLQVADFEPDLNVDSWYQAFLTIQGKIGDWDVLYAGGHFGRTVENQADYSYYAVAYDAMGASSYVTFPDGHGGFLDPDQRFHGHDVYVKDSHEFRISSPHQYRLRGLLGVFYERQSDAIIADYMVPGLTAAGDARAIPGRTDDIFFTGLKRIDRDFAVFGEMSFDLLENLTLTAGGRYFTVDNTLVGYSGFISDVQSAACLPTTNTAIPCQNVDKEVKESGETHKVNLSWRVAPQRMLYFTYSTGFRPGGVNRRAVAPPYEPDTLSNFEIGWKTTWLDGRFRFNGAVFDEEWKGVQYALSPPGFQGVTLIYNAGNARSYGFEGDLAYRPIDSLTFTLSGTILHAALTKTFCNFDSNGDPTECAPAGTRLPVQPNYKVTFGVRYEFQVADFNFFLEGDVHAQGSSTSALFTDNEAILGPTRAFASADLSGGFTRGNWRLEMFIQNIADQRGVLSVNTDCSVTYCGPYALNYVTKPRLVGIKLGEKF